MSVGSGPINAILGNEPFGAAPGPGLTNRPRRDWPAVVRSRTPIEGLRPRSDHHRRVLNYLQERIFMAEHEMAKFYPRWRANEKRLQAWIDLQDFERIIKDANDAGHPPKAIHITIPFTFATQATIATYMLQVFTGRRPMFPVGTYGSNVESALKMEIVLQYQADHMRMVRQLWQFYNDWQTYGFSVLRTRWAREFAMRTRKTTRPVLDLETMSTSEETVREQEEKLIYEGNRVEAQDPFMFFPDPRVPLSDVSEKGEFVFWRLFRGKHELKRLETQGDLMWVDDAATTVSEQARGFAGGVESARDLLSGGSSTPGSGADSAVWARGYYKVDQGSIEIIPRELGLGDSEKVEKWQFTVLNDSQIVQANRVADDHGRHPVVICEPLTMGYSFGAAGYSDYLGGIQDSMSWFMNSHMDNVRKSINDMLVVDPTMVEMKDLKSPEPGKLIRLKPAAVGRDVRTFLNQLQVNDVTRGHVADMQVFLDIGQRISAVTDNLLGLQDPGGRKTATEVRTSNQAAASRLAALAKIVSAQGHSDLTYQMSLNTQQWMSQDFYARIVGQDGAMTPLVIGPDDLIGDFHYPIHDGSLPTDKVALFDLWRQVFEGVLQDPELRATYSVPKIFEFMAELGGAKNIKNFRLRPEMDSIVAQQAQAGNLAPIPGAVGPAGLSNQFTGLGGPRIGNAGLQ